MLSQVQQRKFDAYFKLLDFDKDGYLERRDFEEIADNFASRAGLPKESGEYKQIQGAWLASWEHVKEVCGTDHDGRITSDEWTKTLERTVSDEERYNQYVTPVAEGLFQLLDTNGDGHVGRDEYRQFISSMRGEEGDADSAFEKLDSNRDGQLSKDEVLAAVRDYHASSDPEAPGNWLFGPF